MYFKAKNILKNSNYHLSPSQTTFSSYAPVDADVGRFSKYIFINFICYKGYLLKKNKNKKQ
jgi:hypothetical protein